MHSRSPSKCKPRARSTLSSSPQKSEALSTSLPPILALQRTIGNQALLQRGIQRKCACGATCTSCRDKPTQSFDGPGQIARHFRLQTKPTIGEPNDRYEREADRVADLVLRTTDAQVQRKTAEGTDSTSPTLTQSPVASSAGGRGRPLPRALRSYFEPRFGRRLGHVAIHADPEAGAAAQAIHAAAFTVGRNIVFAPGQYRPETSEGKRLLAHELTHVIQQSGSSQERLQCFRQSSTSPSSPPAADRADAECPGYERGERPASHSEPGHLDPDVERIAPDKLLIADFGADWRHVKASTRSDPMLQAWLSAWETDDDDSYRLRIVGYSDCLGDEDRNINLRQGRARHVEALLGSAAQSRVLFRGMAALNRYITDNNTPASRARNRGVIVEFHQAYDFPEEEVTVTPESCGPDSTQWLIDQMNRNRNHPVIRTQRETQWPNWIPFFNLGWNYGALSDFRDLVKSGAPWDFKNNQPQWRSGAGRRCPTSQCDKTLVLCGRCFSYDLPGNIHYGYVGRMASIRAWFLHNRAAAAQVGGIDPAHDTAAIDIGIAMADRGTSLCDEIARHDHELNREGTSGCGRCPRQG